MRSVGYTAERCLLALRAYWDEMDTVNDELERLAEADAEAVRSCQVQFAQLLRDLDADLEVRRGPSAIVRMSDVEAHTLLPALREARRTLTDLPGTPDRSWGAALARAQSVLQQASRALVCAPHAHGAVQLGSCSA